MNPSWLQRPEHKADEMVSVTAATLPELFERAAWAMFSILTDVEAVRERDRVAVAVEASDREALLVKWLAELNFLHQTQQKLFCRFDVQAIGDTHLRAEAHGETRDPARHPVYVEIKAVTYHGLSVREEAGGWHATVLFDV